MGSAVTGEQRHQERAPPGQQLQGQSLSDVTNLELESLLKAQLPREELDANGSQFWVISTFSTVAAT